MKILVLGIGNLVMSDDGVGVRVVQHLQQTCRFPDEVTLLDGGTLGLDLLPQIGAAEKLLVVDAVETGAAPGTLVRLYGEEIPLALETKVSPHQMGLKDLLTVASLVGEAPEEMVLLGVQPESIEMSMELTPAVAAQVEPLANQVLQELEGWGVAALH
ncbi:HyaD/HybD family hydrogenase maturation endopeptidase [Geomesophilobacter sediminis]|uniref:HyaD/HybD family hydrogenase maturation endopeptidase n=1 Tax=Geomesophilobacter sediminis TaxID=2798584 RepID=A0A8J7M4K5_9BACT|nr:HyaD/HybD family hydrogenase maturation endopeptidase [Geomesophilobacter sediminis]MBJ6727848.1 HyaD/HybD family hydrogenase maturation endopeptidase [Geomesophilobacter sediminis]